MGMNKRVLYSPLHDEYEKQTGNCATTASKDCDGDWFYGYTESYVQWLESKLFNGLKQL